MFVRNLSTVIREINQEQFMEKEEVFIKVWLCTIIHETWLGDNKEVATELFDCSILE
jgi:hypothetical protein